MWADGLVIFVVGMPNGVGETSLDAASAPEATPTAITATPTAHRPGHRVITLRTLMASPSFALDGSHRR
jgi:hypothetical protein